MAEALCDRLFADDVIDGELQHPSDAEDLFGILEAWEDCVSGGGTPRGGVEALLPSADAATPKSSSAAKRPHHQAGCDSGDDGTVVQEPKKRQRCSQVAVAATAGGEGAGAKQTTTTSHIAVERNRRKQMNDHLAVLRSLMPCFYVKRGDQASIIGGVVDYIKELQQLLRSLEAKKQRKAYTEHQAVLSPRPPAAACCSPRLPLSPRPPLPSSLKSTPPMSPRPAVLPISPRTPPTPSSPYNKLCRQPSLPPMSLSLPLPLPPPAPPGSAYTSPAMTPTATSQESYQLPSSLDAIAAELCAYAANNKQLQPTVPEVKVEFSGANLVVKTVSPRAPGQAVKVIAALEGRSLEILHAKISTVDDTAVNSFTTKIGIECDLSAEELVQEIQQAFS